MKKRLTLKLVGNKQYYFNNFAITAGLVIMTGLVVVVGLFGTFAQSTSFIDFLGGAGSLVVNSMIVQLSLTMAVILIFALLIVLITSKRVAGPMYRLEDSLKTMLKGDWDKPLKFRKGDEFGSVGHALSEFRDHFK